MRLMTCLPRRRLLWIGLFIAAITALIYAEAVAWVDENGILHDSPFLPLGGVLAVIAVIVLGFDVLLTVRSKKD